MSMPSKPDMNEICGFDKNKLRKTETQEKNPLPTKEGECLVRGQERAGYVVVLKSVAKYC
uniref:Uncharacterized protein n=1 Tax=Erpetoichthys calabaricus TaxID=27687 RepID=A0A8C4X7Q6_ERPCA